MPRPKKPTTDHLFAELKMSAIERPRIRFAYYVTGAQVFPVDMLRLNEAFPSTDLSSKLITDHAAGLRSIGLISWQKPDLLAWQYAGWIVSYSRFEGETVVQWNNWIQAHDPGRENSLEDVARQPN